MGFLRTSIVLGSQKVTQGTMPTTIRLRSGRSSGWPAWNSAVLPAPHEWGPSVRASIRLSHRECDRQVSRGAALLGWVLSSLLHGIILAVAVLSVQLTLPRAIPQQASFRWEVSLLAAPPSEALTADGTQSQTPSPVAETSEHNIHESPMVEPMLEPPSHLEQSFPQEEPASSVSVRPEISRPVPPAEHPFHERQEREGSALMPVANPGASVLPPREVDSEHDSSRLQVEMQRESPTVLQRPARVTRSVVNRATVPDYSWLTEALRVKLERVKIYPPSAKAGHAQGRVVVQIRIQDDGRIDGVQVEESSGYPVLDQAALDALQAISPLSLEHRFDGPSVVMVVPIHYQLE